MQELSPSGQVGHLATVQNQGSGVAQRIVYWFGGPGGKGEAIQIAIPILGPGASSPLGDLDLSRLRKEGMTVDYWSINNTNYRTRVLPADKQNLQRFFEVSEQKHRIKRVDQLSVCDDES